MLKKIKKKNVLALLEKKGNKYQDCEKGNKYKIVNKQSTKAEKKKTYGRRASKNQLIQKEY